MEQKKVWTIISRDKAKENGWKIIKTRWIDINKGDDLDVVYRSRLVGKEFADKRVDGLFAGTPPLEALRFLVHEVATVDDCQSGDTGGPDEKVMMINDVARAFFEAKATRKVSRGTARRMSRSLGRSECCIIEYELIWNQRCSHELAGGGGKRDVQIGIQKGTVQSMFVFTFRMEYSSVSSWRRFCKCGE